MEKISNDVDRIHGYDVAMNSKGDAVISWIDDFYQEFHNEKKV